MNSSTVNRYSTFGIFLHWLTAITVCVAFMYGPGGSEVRVYSPNKDLERQIHETLGLIVFTLSWIRLFWRMTTKTPDNQISHLWMHKAAKATQISLYVLLFTVPITAVLGAWLENHPLTLLAGIEIAPMINESHALGELISEIHTWLGNAILWLSGIHACAGLYHHYILKDSVLASMLPTPKAPKS